MQVLKKVREQVLSAVAQIGDWSYAKVPTVVTLGLAAASASAQTDPFDTVMTNATTAVTEYAGALVVLSGVAVLFMIGMKYIKKIRGAA